MPNCLLSSPLDYTECVKAVQGCYCAYEDSPIFVCPPNVYIYHCVGYKQGSFGCEEDCVSEDCPNCPRCSCACPGSGCKVIWMGDLGSCNGNICSICNIIREYIF